MKKSFVLHKDSLDILESMPDELAGKLFKAIRAFQIGNPVELPIELNYVFKLFENQFIRDDANYLKRSETNKTNGSKGGKQKVANATKRKRTVANVADSDNDNDSDSGSVNVNDTSNDVNIPVDKSTLHPLQIFVRDNYPNVSSLKTQLTKEQCERLLGAYTKDAIKTKLDAMENKPNLKKNYLAVYNTLNNWLGMERQRNPNFGKLPLTPEQELEILKKERGYHVE